MALINRDTVKLGYAAVKYRGSTHGWVTAHPLVSWNIEFPEETEQMPISPLRSTNKEGRAAIRLQPVVQSWQSLIHRPMRHTLLPSKSAGTFRNLWYNKICYTKAHDKARPSHWPQRLSHCLTIFLCAFILGLSRCLLSGSHICFDCFTNNHSWWPVNEMWQHALQTSERCNVSQFQRWLTLQLGLDMPWANLIKRQVWLWWTTILFLCSGPNKGPSPISPKLCPHFRWVLQQYFTVYVTDTSLSFKGHYLQV